MPISFGSISADHQYYPERPDFKKPPKYSLGSRRENEPGVLTVVTSTNEAVGPATYMAEKVTKTSNMKLSSKWTFPRAPRKDMGIKTFERHQTYDTRFCWQYKSSIE